MANISVNTEKIILSSKEILKSAKRVKQLEGDLKGMKLNEFHVEKTMKNILASVSDEAAKMDSLGDALDRIAQKYKETENSLLEAKSAMPPVMAMAKKSKKSGTDKRNVFQKFFDWMTDEKPDKYDTTTKEQEKAADLAMKQKIWDVLQKEKYSVENWEKASIEERKKILQDYMNELIKIYGLQDVKSKIKWKKLTYTSSSVEMGNYNDFFHRVTLNESILTDDIPGWDSYDLFATISHELRHAYQHEAIDNPTDYMVSQETIDKWDKNLSFGNYISPSVDYYEYRNQPVEKDAQSFEINRYDDRPS